MNFYVMCLEFGGLLLVVRGLLFILVRAITTVFKGVDLHTDFNRHKISNSFSSDIQRMVSFIFSSKLVYNIVFQKASTLPSKSSSSFIGLSVPSISRVTHPVITSPTTEALMRNATHRKKV